MTVVDEVFEVLSRAWGIGASKISPLRSSYPHSGAAPQFALRASQGCEYDVEVAIDPCLLDGANRTKRTEDNYFSSLGGNTLAPGVQSLATTDAFTYQLPPAVWARLSQSAVIYYRLTISEGGRARESSLNDLDWKRAPYVLVSAPRLSLLAQMTPTEEGFLADADAPSFAVQAGTQLFYSVEVATDPKLFLPFNAHRRHMANFFSSRYGWPTAPGQDLLTRRGSATYTLPITAWEQLRSAPRIYYRLISNRSVLGLDTVYSVTNSSYERAPFLTTCQILDASVAAIDHLDGRALGDNPPPAFTVRGDTQEEFTIELATAPNILAVGVARDESNYFSTASDSHGIARQTLNLKHNDGIAPPGYDVGSYVVPEPVWRVLGQQQFIYYRVTTFRREPAGIVNEQQSAVDATHRMPGLWGGLPLDSTAAVGGIPFVVDGKINTLRLESDHGQRRLAAGVNGRVWHPGIDLAAPDGTPVYAIADGVVDNRGGGVLATSNNLGWLRLDHGSYKTSYFHLNLPPAATIAQGIRFRRGQQIGTVGNTGTVGVHLHFELEDTAKNPLCRVRHTERADPLVTIVGNATLGPEFSGSAANNRLTPYTVEMKTAHAGVDPIAIISVGVTSRGDKDLVSVCFKVLDEEGSPEANNWYLLDYSAMESRQNANGMLTANGTEGGRTPRMRFPGSGRVEGLPALTDNTRREFYITDGPAAPEGNPQAQYNALIAGGAIGANPSGFYDMYVIPCTTQAGAETEDWFNYMWHMNPYTDDTGPHQLAVIATDLKGNSSVLNARFGVELSAIDELSVPPGGIGRFPLHLHLFDYTAADVQLSLGPIPPGWGTVVSWPAASIHLDANSGADLAVEVTAPADAPVGTSVAIRVTARSARVPHMKDSVILQCTVANPTTSPRIAATSRRNYRGGLPPIFLIESSIETHVAVEVADRADFYDGAPSLREYGGYFNSRTGGLGEARMPIETIDGLARYAVPSTLWQRLTRPLVLQLHYRLLTSPDASWATSNVVTGGTIEIIPDWPAQGPEIEAFHALNPPLYETPPAFFVRVMPGAYYAVEVATDESLFDNNLAPRNEHTFFSSWFGSSIEPPRPLHSPTGYAVYHLPSPAWERMKGEFVAGRAAQLHYIVRQAMVPEQLFGTLHSSIYSIVA